MSITITKGNFEKEVLKSTQPVLLDFWADWCGPCRMISPILEELSKEVSGQAKVGKINVDQEPELASAFQVMSIPTLITVENGKVKETAVGVRDKNALKKMLGV